MSIHTLIAALALLVLCLPMAQAGDAKPASIHPLKVMDIDGKPVELSRYKGKVLLVVNVASECGYTPQYEGLQKLYTKFAKEGLVILGFPCNDFGAQEPGTEAKIKEFACGTYKVEFPLFSKVRITGKDASPLYRQLTERATNPVCPGEVRWNFEKFLIDREGRVVARFASDVEPDSADLLNRLRQALEK